MLRHFGIEEAAAAVEKAIAVTLARSQVRTPDIGGTSSTEEFGAAIATEVSRSG
jgi:tartrate dehydrogenase/decarboxylase/D-malate dehydrogenase